MIIGEGRRSGGVALAALFGILQIRCIADEARLIGGTHEEAVSTSDAHEESPATEDAPSPAPDAVLDRLRKVESR